MQPEIVITMKKSSLPPAGPILDAALQLPDASLVIHRHGALVEFKTDKLAERLSRWEEEGYVSWQVNGFEDHHCHVDLASIDTVLFDAAAASCQGGRLNFTVWFLAKDGVGNPYKPNGAFSVTLNRPYDSAGDVRRDIVSPVFDLFDRFKGETFVEATPEFLASGHATGLYSAAAKITS